jgi:hypothetical protein
MVHIHNAVVLRKVSLAHGVTPAKAGVQNSLKDWIPAFAHWRQLKDFFVLISAYKTDEVSARHSREGGNPGFSRTSWTPACAGVTLGGPCCILKYLKIH